MKAQRQCPRCGIISYQLALRSPADGEKSAPPAGGAPKPETKERLKSISKRGFRQGRTTGPFLMATAGEPNDKSKPFSIVLTEQQWLILGYLLLKENQDPTLPEELRPLAYEAALAIQQRINRIWLSELPEHLKGMVVNLAGQKMVTPEYLYGSGPPEECRN